MSCRAFATTLAATHMIIIGQNTKLPYADTASSVKSQTSERTGLDVGSGERGGSWIERTGLDVGSRLEVKPRERGWTLDRGWTWAIENGLYMG